MLSLAETGAGFKLRNEKEEFFWQEAASPFNRNPVPLQVRKKLTGLQYEPGERSALALMWGGLGWYEWALRQKNNWKDEGDLDPYMYEEIGTWLPTFKKAAKAQRRTEGKEKTTSHNLELFLRAWEDIQELSTQDLSKMTDLVDEELIQSYWSASYCFWMAACHLKIARECYDRGTWSVGIQNDFREILTPVAEIDYDRLLFRSALTCFGTPIGSDHLLPNNADGWLSIGSERSGMLALYQVLQNKVDEIDLFDWTDKPFYLDLGNACHLIVEKARPDSLRDEMVGVALVFTPGGMYIEEFFLSDHSEIMENHIDRTFPGNSLRCQVNKQDDIEAKKEENNKRLYLRKMILSAIWQAHKQPNLQQDISPPKALLPPKKKNEKSKFKAPKGNNFIWG